MKKEEVEALLQFRTWLSKDFMIFPRKHFTGRTFGIMKLTVRLYLFFWDELLNGEFLMDDEGNTYMVHTTDELMEIMEISQRPNMFDALNHLGSMGLIRKKRLNDWLGKDKIFDIRVHYAIYLCDQKGGYVNGMDFQEYGGAKK